MFTVEPFFFGEQRQQFGIFHPPLGAENGQGVLICPPLLDEQIRAHWTLREIAEQLARSGYSVLRFDYRGMGNSLGSSCNTSIQSLQEDIQQAYQQLKRLAGRDVYASAIGTRLSAALLYSSDLTDLERIVSWDPLLTGRAWLDSMEQINALINSTLGQRDFEVGEYLAQPLSAEFVSELGGFEVGELPKHAENFAVLGAADLSQTRFQSLGFDEVKTCDPQDYVWEIYDLQLIYGHAVVAQTVECF